MTIMRRTIIHALKILGLTSAVIGHRDGQQAAYHAVLKGDNFQNRNKIVSSFRQNIEQSKTGNSHAATRKVRHG
jgi:hypothetical protein